MKNTSIVIFALAMVLGPSYFLVSPAKAGCGSSECSAVGPLINKCCVQTGLGGPITCKVFWKRQCVKQSGNPPVYGWDYTLAYESQYKICAASGDKCERPEADPGDPIDP